MKKAIFFFHAFFHFACSPVAFATPCGLQVHESLPPEWTVTAVTDLEGRAIGVFSRLAPFDPAFEPARACAAWGKFDLYVRGEASWERGGQFLAGFTSCSMGTIEVGNLSPRAGALAHELAHAAQACAGGSTHEGWAEGGVFDAIDQIRL